MKKFKLAEHDFSQYYLEDYDPDYTWLPTVEISEEMYEAYQRTMKEFVCMQRVLASINCIHEGEDNETT